jgi:hypothetical protein
MKSDDVDPSLLLDKALRLGVDCGDKALVEAVVSAKYGIML